MIKDIRSPQAAKSRKHRIGCSTGQLISYALLAASLAIPQPVAAQFRQPTAQSNPSDFPPPEAAVKTYNSLISDPVVDLNDKQVTCQYLATQITKEAGTTGGTFDGQPIGKYDQAKIGAIEQTIKNCAALAETLPRTSSLDMAFDAKSRNLRTELESAARSVSHLRASFQEAVDARATAAKAQADAAANTAAVNAPPPPGAFCFASMWDNPERGFPLPVKEPGIRTCIPSSNAFIGEPPFIVSELSLASPGDQLGRCKTMMPIQGEAQGIVGNVRLTCEVNGTAFNTSIRWTADKFILSEMSVYICGPGTSLPGSEFEKGLIERFGSPAVSAQNRYVFAKNSYSLEVGGAPIGENAGAAAVKRCPPDTRLWKFEMIAYRQNDGRRPPFGIQQKFTPAPHFADFEQHVLEKLKGQNTKFEKF